MIKAMKKLKKYWPRKKRRKRTYHEPYYYYPPPPTCHSCCCSSSASAPQPSAPPLPPWLDAYPTYEPISTPASQSFPETVIPTQTQWPSQEIVVETVNSCPITLHDTAAAAATTKTLSYQQYMVPEPVYDVPVGKKPGKERLGGFFGCFIAFGLNLIHCFCPCFHTREDTRGE